MKSTFKILFYARKNQVNKAGEVGIMVRITVNGENAQFSSKLNVDPKLWDTKGNRGVGKTMQINQLNSVIDNIKASLFFHYREIERQESSVTAEKVRNAFLGITVKRQMLLVVFEKHNEDLSKRIGKGISESAVGRYERTRKRLANYMKIQYNINDIALKEINYSFITGFETYLRTTCDCNVNTTAKFMQQFKRIIILAKNNGWISADPFVNYKMHFEKVDRGYLTQEQLNMIMQKSFAIPRLEQVKDIFVFSCFTGLAYIDVKNLKEKDIRSSFDGQLWIMKKRQKTNILSSILLLDIPKVILEKYKDEIPNGKVLPVLSNQQTGE